MIKVLINYFSNKNPIERYLFIFIIAFALMTFIWLFLIKPIQNVFIEKESRLNKLLTLGDTIQNLPKESIKMLNKKGSLANTSVDINIAIEQTAKAHKINITESTNSEGLISLTIKEVEFNKFNQWLAELHARYFIKIEKMNIFPIKNQPGKIEVKNLSLSKET